MTRPEGYQYRYKPEDFSDYDPSNDPEYSPAPIRQLTYEELEQENRQLRQENQQLRQYRQKTRDIMTNPHASPTFKALSWAQLDLFPEEVLSGAIVHLDVKKVYQHVAVSDRSATNYFKATKEVGGAAYSYEHGQNEKSGKRFTECDITYAPTFGTTALNASAVVQRAREEEKRRRDEKTKALEAIICPACGQAAEHMALVPYCSHCNTEIPTGIQTAKIEDIRMVEREGEEEPKPLATTSLDSDMPAGDPGFQEPPEFADIPFPPEEEAPAESYSPYIPGKAGRNGNEQKKPARERGKI